MTNLIVDYGFLCNHYSGSHWNKEYISQREQILLFISWAKCLWMLVEKHKDPGLPGFTNKDSRAELGCSHKNTEAYQEGTFLSKRMSERTKESFGWKGLLISAGPTLDSKQGNPSVCQVAQVAAFPTSPTINVLASLWAIWYSIWPPSWWLLFLNI